jgi:hypothetical protein
MPNTYPNTQYLVLTNPAVTSSSWVLADGVITINGQQVCKYKELRKASVTVSVNETLQVTTLTPTAAANSVYTLMIQQYNFSTGKTYTGTYTYTTAASGDTATTISDAFKNQINADQNIKITTDALGGATIVLTAEAGFPVFTVTILQVGGGLTQATGTPGVVAVGTSAALALQGITVTGTNYTTVHLEYAPITGLNIKDSTDVYSVYDLYLDTADGSTSALVTVITNNLNGLNDLGTAANPEAIATI